MGPLATVSGTTGAAQISAIRSSRHEAERRSLLRRVAAARARQLEERSESSQAESVEPVREPELPQQTSCPSWRTTAARQAYLSTLPPPPRGETPLVRLSHKA